MRIKMKVHISGTRGGAGVSEWPHRGGEIEVPDGEGADLVAAGMAVEVEVEKKAAPAPVVEKATAPDADVEKRPLTTDTGPVKRGPGRPRKNA